MGLEAVISKGTNTGVGRSEGECRGEQRRVKAEGQVVEQLALRQELS